MLLKLLGKVGTPGGTARWAAKAYFFSKDRLTIRDNIPDLNQIFSYMISARFEVLPNKDQEAYLLKEAEHWDSLLQLVIELLKVECDLHKNTPAAIETFVEVAYRELQKRDIPEEIILGPKSLVEHTGSAMRVPEIENPR